MEVKESIMGLQTTGATGVTAGSFNSMLTKVTEMATSAAAAAASTAQNTTTSTIHATKTPPDLSATATGATTNTTPTPAPAVVSDMTTPSKTMPNPLNIPDMSTAIVPHSGATTGSISLASPPPFSFDSMKKKRGRPRKYAPDGSPLPVTPKPFTTPGISPLQKRGRGRPLGSGKKHQIHHHLPSPSAVASSPTAASALGEFVLGLACAGFTPHAITVAAGEDVACKIMSFLQQDSRGVCILSANGAISNATLRQPLTSGGTLTYEGRFEILSLSGSFLVTEMPGGRSRTGGLSVSLAGPDGKVIGGSVAGMLVAASPVQVVMGSFACGINNTMTSATTTKPKKMHKNLTKLSKPNPEFSMNDKHPEGGPTMNQHLAGVESSKGQMIAVGLQTGASEQHQLNMNIDMSSPAQ